MTQAQIKAVAKAMKECSVGGELYYDEDYIEAAKAALTAAAEVDDGVCPTCGADRSKIVSDLQNAEAATIEACAQVVKDLAEKYLVKFPAEYNAIMRAHAAIRARK